MNAEGGKKRYKTWELYACITLNRLAQELGIDIYQRDIENVLDRLFLETVPSIPKVEVSYEIKSNHHMTNKVLDRLEADGLVVVTKQDRNYSVFITRAGVMYLRRFNEYFVHTYNNLIQDHYRYRQLPSWFVSSD